MLLSVPNNESSSRCANGAVRLVNGSVSNEGLAEVCFNGRWGAICDNDWDVTDATVLCDQLGFPGNSKCSILAFLILSFFL